MISPDSTEVASSSVDAIEAELRRKVARRLRISAAILSRNGLITDEALEALEALSPTLELPVIECRWCKYGSERGEIDVCIPFLGIAIECKVRGRRSRLNWEEALGQALRDRQLPWIRATYIAVPLAECSEWMAATIRHAGVGLIAVDTSTELNFKAVQYISHPTLRKYAGEASE